VRAVADRLLVHHRAVAPSPTAAVTGSVTMLYTVPEPVTSNVIVSICAGIWLSGLLAALRVSAAALSVPTVPLGQTCPAAKPKPVTNAITASFDNSQATVFNATVNNSSPLPASCNYDAKGPLTDTKRTFLVAPNASHTEPLDGLASPFHATQYTITITCTETSNTQTQPLGSVTQPVGW
jgi:hypothetical protein